MLLHIKVEQKVEREQVAKVTGTNKDDSLAKALLRLGHPLRRDGLQGDGGYQQGVELAEVPLLHRRARASASRPTARGILWWSTR